MSARTPTFGLIGLAAANQRIDAGVASAGFGYIAAASSAQGEPLTVIKLLPMGVIKARDGRQWLLADRAHADQVVAASQPQAGQADMMFDYDHQSFFGAKDGVGGQAPASGWIKTLEARDDGIWAHVDWTAAAEAKLKAREYRYVSPLFYHEPVGDHRITRIVNGALVNTPAITELPAVASASGGALTPQGISMKFTEALAQALGLQATATEADILAALSAKLTETASAATAALTPVAKALGLADTAKPEDVVAAASAAVAAKADPTQFAPMAVVTALQDQVKALTQGQTAAAAATAVDAAIEAGKVAPALKDWALSYATADLAGFKSFADAAPKVVTPGGGVAKPAPGGEPELTNELQAAARALGITDEAILATAKEGN